MRHQRVTLLIYGLRTYLGREIARFGRAMGHRIVGVVADSIPQRDEPWMHGIHWVRGDESVIEAWSDNPPAAIVYCDTTLWGGDRGRYEEILVRRPRQLLEAAREHLPSPRFVLRSTVAQPLLSSEYTTYHRRAEQLVARSELPHCILRLPLLYGPDRPDSVAAMMVLRALARLPIRPADPGALQKMRVERAALAGLRAALEPDMEGIYYPDDIARIGDVMIPQ